MLAGVLAVIGVGVFSYTQYRRGAHSGPTTVSSSVVSQLGVSPTPAHARAPSSRVPSSDIVHAVSVESYIKKHITTFSPVKATLGGTFYVTQVDAYNGKGTVNYEDGHSAYIADFAYTVDDFGSVSINNFTVRKNP
jgi:hypothetical protein